MLKFKTDRIQTEWNALPVHNSRLAQVVRALVIYAEVELKKDVTLTCIFRTPEENTAVGGIPNSPHLVWNAVDLRSSDFTAVEISKMLGFLNCFTYRYPKQTALCHSVPGGAMHFHLQVLKESELAPG